MTMKSFSELSQLQTFEERLEYLKCLGHIGIETFGHDRYLNQLLYKSYEWRTFRNSVMLRDSGCDLGILDRAIPTRAVIHHINPITVEDVVNRSSNVFDMNNVITVSERTHRAIHYGSTGDPADLLIQRSENDTCPWK